MCPSIYMGICREYVNMNVNIQKIFAKLYDSVFNSYYPLSLSLGILKEVKQLN